MTLEKKIRPEEEDLEPLKNAFREAFLEIDSACPDYKQVDRLIRKYYFSQGPEINRGILTIMAEAYAFGANIGKFKSDELDEEISELIEQASDEGYKTGRSETGGIDIF